MFQYVLNLGKKIILLVGKVCHSLIHVVLPLSHQDSIYDLSITITSKTLIFPGDPVFKAESVESLEKGGAYNLCIMHMGNHLGTHIDFPAHVIKGGKTSSDYPIQSLVGSGIIIEVPQEEIQKNNEISGNFVKSQTILKKDFVFFKTANSKLSADKFEKKFVHLSESAADELVKKQVKIVGIDYLSVDSLDDEKLSVHNRLLSNDVLIVENLNLKNVSGGRFKEISVVPLNIPDMDGLPVRVLAKR